MARAVCSSAPYRAYSLYSYHEASDGKCVPRAVLFDIVPGVIGAVTLRFSALGTPAKPNRDVLHKALLCSLRMCQMIFVFRTVSVFYKRGIWEAYARGVYMSFGLWCCVSCSARSCFIFGLSPCYVG